MANKFEDSSEGANDNKSRVTCGGYEIGDYRIEISSDSAKESIKTNFPDFEIRSIESLSEEKRLKGMSNEVFLVNGEYIFRFPRHKKGNSVLQVELAVVPKLHDYLSTEVPNFEYVGKQVEGDLKFIGYKEITGEILTKDILEDESGKPNPHITEQIATFFNEIHSFDTNEALASGVKERDMKKFFEGQLEDAREQVYPVLRKRFSDEADSMIGKIEKAFGDYLSDNENFKYKRSLLHGDLEAMHIIVDPHKRNLVGIIDFGGLHVGDPDYDLFRPYLHYGREFIEKLSKHYSDTINSDRLFKKLDFFGTAQIVHRTLRPILLNDEKSLSGWALPKLRERLLENKA